MTPIEAKQMAAKAISDAWQDATSQGVPAEVVASTALTAALASLVQTHGRDGATNIANRLIEAVNAGRFDHTHEKQ